MTKSEVRLKQALRKRAGVAGSLRRLDSEIDTLVGLVGTSLYGRIGRKIRCKAYPQFHTGTIRRFELHPWSRNQVVSCIVEWTVLGKLTEVTVDDPSKIIEEVA